MAYESPGIFANGSGVSDAQARTEVLAHAFNDAAGEYFQREYQYESALEEATERRDQMKLYGAIAVAVGLLLAGLGLVDGNTLVALAGIAIALAGGGYAYWQYSDAEEEIANQQENLRQNRPDGSVSFVSKIGVPFYVVPYDQNHMIFDGLANAPRTSIELAHLDGDAIIDRQNELADLVDQFEDELEEETVLQPAELEELDDSVSDHREIERPITEKIDEISQIIRDTEQETIAVPVHANNNISYSISELSRAGHLHRNGTMPTVGTVQSRTECEEMVAEIRGFESEAVSGDMLDQIKRNRETVLDLTEDFVNRLANNQETVRDHFDTYEQTLHNATHKFVCKACLEEELEAVDDELKLIDEILSPETGSFGIALDDPDLDKIATDGEYTFRQQIRNDIRTELPELSGELRRAYNTLPDIADSHYCEKHETTEPVEIPQNGHLFGEVWRSLYYDFREPIMKQTKDLEKEAEDVRQNKEQKMIDLAQYEQIVDSVEREYLSVKSEYKTAEKIARGL